MATLVWFNLTVDAMSDRHIVVRLGALLSISGLNERLELDTCGFWLRFGFDTIVLRYSLLASSNDSLASLQLFERVASKYAWFCYRLCTQHFGQIRLVSQSIPAR